MNDYRYMQCEWWREILSAQLDGEETPEERAAAERHLDGCGDCRSWLDAAAAVTRRARTQVVTSLPDLTDTILATAVPLRGRWRLGTASRARVLVGLRAALGLLGAVQLVLGLAQVGRGAVAVHPHPTGQHLWHEAAAWNIAVGAGFLFVALRRTSPAGLVPMLSAFVATLVLLSVNDLVTAQVAVARLVSHAFLLGGYVITLLLSHPGLRRDGPPPGRQSWRSRWRAQFDDVDDLSPVRLAPQPHSARAADRWAA